MGSLWGQTVSLPKFPALDGGQTTDVLIIGGGLTGLLCAHMLKEAGADCMVAEAGTICGGVTKNTTAKVTAQHGLIYDKLICRFGQERAKQYLEANLAALERYRLLCREIPCHWEEQNAYVYCLNDREKLRREMAALGQLGQKTSFADRLPLPVIPAGAIKWEGQAQFHPLEFVAAIAPGLPVYEHTNVRQLVGTTALTDHGKIRAKTVIVATHFPFLNKHGSYFLKLYQHRSYVLALENGPDVEGMYVDEAKTGLSFRNYEKLLLLGGGGHRTGKPGGSWQELEAVAARHYPRAKIVGRWATQDCMTLDGVPYIGPYSACTEGLYVATGFGKWGMTNAMAAAMILCDMVQGRKSPYGPVFSPSRSILRPQLAVNGLETAMSLLTPTARRCPHLGCALKWNKAEHTWDCPCHGSRFSQTGERINGPATGDLPQKS